MLQQILLFALVSAKLLVLLVYQHLSLLSTKLLLQLLIRALVLWYSVTTHQVLQTSVVET